LRLTGGVAITDTDPASRFAVSVAKFDSGCRREVPGFLDGNLLNRHRRGRLRPYQGCALPSVPSGALASVPARMAAHHESRFEPWSPAAFRCAPVVYQGTLMQTAGFALELGAARPHIRRTGLVRRPNDRACSP
jgi:hypothetical protein